MVLSKLMLGLEFKNNHLIMQETIISNICTKIASGYGKALLLSTVCHRFESWRCWQSYIIRFYKGPEIKSVVYNSPIELAFEFFLCRRAVAQLVTN